MAKKARNLQKLQLILDLFGEDSWRISNDVGNVKWMRVATYRWKVTGLLATATSDDAAFRPFRWPLGILSPDYYETDADGHRRDRAAAISFALDARISSFNDGQITARGNGNAVVVTGEEAVTSDGALARALFTHVCARDASGQWRLVSTAQERSGR